MITAMLAGLRPTLAVALAVLAGALGCAAKSAKPGTVPISPYVESGFLSDYTQLKTVAPGSLRKTYRNPEVDLAHYPKLMFDRVTLWRDTDDTEPVESSDFQAVANDLYATISKELGRSFELVTEPGSDVARIRMAVEDVDEPDDQLDVYVTNAEPVALESDEPLPPGLIEFGKGAWMEGEILDSTNDTVLLTVVDRLGDVLPHAETIKTWRDLHAAFIAWADRISEKLEEARRAAHH